MKKITFIILGLFLFSFVQGQDTFSITAIDTLTGEVGSAGASCIDETAIPTGCYILSDVKPGIGVIHTQAYWNPANQNYASSLMDLGLPPEDIIDSLVAHDVQNNPHIRQYGIIDLHEGSIRRAAYTGVNCDNYKSHIIGPNYTIQGNILLGQEILDSMESRFLETEAPLACKLMAALQGAKVIGADTRCFDDGTSSLSAFLRVAQPGDPNDTLYLDLNVPSTPFGVDPIDELQTLVDEWGGCSVSGTGPGTDALSLDVYPNPGTGEIIIKCTNSIIENGTLLILNDQGGLVLKKLNLYGVDILIEDHLSPGLYLFQLSDKNGSTGNGKIIIR